MSSIFKIEGCVKNYAWGGNRFIPELLNRPNPQNIPHAELWVGTHKDGPCDVTVNGAQTILQHAIANDPETLLGERSVRKFGPELPYLFKVLDAAQPLSIQVHPSKDQAAEGFSREEKAGTAADKRNYKDPNHKPELQVPLTDFWMLHGFKRIAGIADNFAYYPEFRHLLHDFEIDSAPIRNTYTLIMKMDRGTVEDRLGPLLRRLREQYVNGAISMDSPDFWACKAADTYGLDRGIFSIYMMNLLHLKPGEATFQAAGIPHAYLFGTTIELMACSDNVLRGGLTPKYVDVDELLKTVNFKGGIPVIGSPVSSLSKSLEPGVELVYDLPLKEGSLSRICLDDERMSFRIDGADSFDVYLVIKGEGEIHTRNDNAMLRKGDIIGIPAGNPVGIYTNRPMEIFRVTTDS